VLNPQNGDRIVTIDSVTSLHPMYTHVFYMCISDRLCVLPVKLQMKSLPVTAECCTVKNIHRSKSEPALHTETDYSWSDKLPDSVRHCQNGCSGTEAHAIYSVNGANGAASTETFVGDDTSQYVALDCEFVGVGPRQLSALGMCHMQLCIACL